MIVRKGACIVEQFFDTAFYLILFFVPDEFICEVLKMKTVPVSAKRRDFEPIIKIHTGNNVQAFFQSMMPYFESPKTPDQSLLELKFRELVLTIADDPRNEELLAYFCSLLKEPHSVTLQRVMEDSYCFNLKMEEFAQLSNRSLSAFKRDFEKQFNTSPGKWLLEKRLGNAMHQLRTQGKTVGEAAFESGFENSSHFSRAFKQRFGISPVSLRQQQTTAPAVTMDAHKPSDP